jgi:hypothetical protein
MITRRDKQEALTGLCEEILTAVRPGLRSSARYRDVGTGRSAQDEIMGDPVYYLETYFAPDQASRTVDTLQGAASEVAHAFQVSLWLEYEDADTYARSSQADYEELVEGPSGLLTTLRGSPDPEAPGHPDVPDWPDGTELGQPQDVAEPIVDLDNRGRLAHLLRFQITLVHSTL